MVSGGDRPEWAVEGRDWPNREHSRFVGMAGGGWHVQHWGTGRRMLLLHGTGASTHSWRDLATLLAADFELLAPDLPGHGFTAMPSAAEGLSLPGMARGVGALLEKIGFAPEIVVGHSAGAAIAIEMTLSGLMRPRLIIALNGALLPIRGATLFSPLAKLLFLNPLAPRLFAWRARGDHATQRLLDGTGSRLDARGTDLYARLFRRPGHVAGTLGMMAGWDLAAFERKLPRLAVPLVMIVAANDRAVPPSDARVVSAKVPSARIVPLSGGGHLLHEEQPARVAEIIRAAVEDVGSDVAEDDL